MRQYLPNNQSIGFSNLKSVSVSMPSSTPHRYTSAPAIGAEVFVSVTCALKRSLSPGSTVSGSCRSTFAWQYSELILMSAYPTARCGNHFGSGLTGRNTVTETHVIGAKSFVTFTGTSRVLESMGKTLTSSGVSCSKPMRAVPLNGDLMSTRASSPILYDGRSNETSTSSGFSIDHG